MEKGTLCGVCGKREAIITCEECGIPLCDTCVREVLIEDTGPQYSLKGGTIDSMRPGGKVRKVCEKCMKEVEFF